MISMDKKYQTRNGRAVRVLCVDMTGTKYPVCVAIADPEGKESCHAYQIDGSLWAGGNQIHEVDLIEIKPTVVFWLNIEITKGLKTEETNMASYLLCHNEDEAKKYAAGYDIIARRVELPIEEQEK